MKLLYLLLATCFSTTLLGQSIKSINPESASKGETIVLSILSKNTFFKTGTNTVKLSNPSLPVIHGTSVTAINDTLLEAKFSFSLTDSAARYDVVVENSQISSPLVLPKAFKLNPRLPLILSITPATAVQGDTVEITVKTRYTHFLKSSNLGIQLNASNNGQGVYASPVTIINDTLIKGRFAFTYMDPITEYDVMITDYPLFMTLEKVFQLKPGPSPPQILSITPDSGRKLDSLVVTVKGRNIFFKRDSCRVVLMHSSGAGGADPVEKTYINDSVMKATFIFNNMSVEGQFDVVSYSALGVYSLPKAFTLLPSLKTPQLLSFDPIEGKQGDSVLIAMHGRNTHFLKDKSTQGFLAAPNGLGISPASTQIINDSLIQCKFHLTYNIKPGLYRVGVYNWLDGSLDASNKFTLKEGDHPPKLLHVSPNKAVQGQKMDVYLTATKNCFSIFKPEAVYLSAISKSIYSKGVVINDSVLKINFNFTVDTNLVGMYNLDLYGYRYGSDYERISLPNAFTIEKNINPPILTEVSPGVANQFDNVSVTIRARGTHFLNNNTSGVYLTSKGNTNTSSFPCKSFTVQDDSTIVCQFLFNANYYPEKVYDVTVYNAIDGTLILKNAFTIKNLYDQEPKITSIDPKQSMPGYSVTINITGVTGAFRPGNIKVKLVNIGVIELEATSVNYINDSYITASFSIPDNMAIGSYYVVVNNLATMGYGYFYLVEYPSKLTGMTPTMASQTDSIKAVITGTRTHFNGTSDLVWLQGNYGMKVWPQSKLVVNDSLMEARFAFNKNHLPGTYTLYLESKVDKTTMKLKDALTLTGMIDTTTLVSVSPKYIGCNEKAKLTIKGNATYFLAEVDTIHVVNTNPYPNPNPNPNLVVYPLNMTIIDDETIVADFILPCGKYDVVVLGKESYVLKGRLFSYPPLAIKEMLEKELVTIFPNPSDGNFTITVGENFIQGELSLMDMYGKEIVRNEKIEASTQIDLSSYSSGMYFIKLIKGGACKTEKIIKQ